MFSLSKWFRNSMPKKDARVFKISVEKPNLGYTASNELSEQRIVISETGPASNQWLIEVQSKPKDAHGRKMWQPDGYIGGRHSQSTSDAIQALDEALVDRSENGFSAIYRSIRHAMLNDEYSLQEVMPNRSIISTPSAHPA